MIEVRRGTQKLYKGHYFIVFYDEDDYLKYMFDNVRDILKFMGRAITRDNVIRINKYIVRALRRDDHNTRFLTGESLKLYIIDTN